jgi:hypothetical protein
MAQMLQSPEILNPPSERCLRRREHRLASPLELDSGA